MRYNFNKKIDIIKYRNYFFAFSALITILGIITLFVFGLNYGVDFKAGTGVDIQLQKSTTKQEISAIIKTAKLKNAEEIRFSTDNKRVMVRFDEVLGKEEVKSLQTEMSKKFGKSVSYEVNTVDSEIAKEMANKAIIGVLIASVGIMLYTIIRFEWRFAIAAIVALMHDAFIVISFFSIFQWEVNLPFVAAVLTIIGYSINDTIVIFDRIRENLRITKKKTYENVSLLVNDSIWQVMTRSINTVVTVIFGALALYIWGSEAVSLFSLAILIGLVSGAYSSIFIASPIWLLLKKATDHRKPETRTSSTGTAKS